VISSRSRTSSGLSGRGEVYTCSGIFATTLDSTDGGEINPNDRRNVVITDIQLAPRLANGNVQYKSTFTIYKPIDMSKAPGIMLYNVPNRGNHSLPGAFHFGGDPGDGFIYNLGHVMLWNGWQADLPISSVAATQEGLDAPIAKNPDGSSVTSLTWQRFANGCRDCVAIPTTTPRATTLAISDIGRNAATLDTTKATLISATSESNTGVRGGVVTIPSTDWAWANCTAAQTFRKSRNRSGARNWWLSQYRVIGVPSTYSITK